MNISAPQVLHDSLTVLLDIAPHSPAAAREGLKVFLVAAMEKIAKGHLDADGDPAITPYEAFIFSIASLSLTVIPDAALPPFLQGVKETFSQLFPLSQTSTSPLH